MSDGDAPDPSAPTGSPSLVAQGATAAVISIALGLLLWIPLSFPGRLINLAAGALADASCADAGFERAACEMTIGLSYLLGPLVLAVALAIGLRWLGPLLAKWSGRLPEPARFVSAPAVATIGFLLIWAPIYEGMGGTWGLVPHVAIAPLVGIAGWAAAVLAHSADGERPTWLAWRRKVPPLVRVAAVPAIAGITSLIFLQLATKWDLATHRTVQFVVLLTLVAMLVGQARSPRASKLASAAAAALVLVVAAPTASAGCDCAELPNGASVLAGLVAAGGAVLSVRAASWTGINVPAPGPVPESPLPKRAPRPKRPKKEKPAKEPKAPAKKEEAPKTEPKSEPKTAAEPEPHPETKPEADDEWSGPTYTSPDGAQYAMSDGRLRDEAGNKVPKGSVYRPDAAGQWRWLSAKENEALDAPAPAADPATPDDEFTAWQKQVEATKAAKFCFACGHEFTTDAKFCGKCGEPRGTT